MRKLERSEGVLDDSEDPEVLSRLDLRENTERRRMGRVVESGVSLCSWIVVRAKTNDVDKGRIMSRVLVVVSVRSARYRERG